MREIKFRAWDKTRNANASYDTFTLTELLQGRVKNYQNYENWEQFTGLLDKNGKEIYEGDILQPVDSKVSRAVVEWKEYQWVRHWLAIDGGEEFSIELDSTELFEVIGNIYENPELLKA